MIACQIPTAVFCETQDCASAAYFILTRPNSIQLVSYIYIYIYIYTHTHADKMKIFWYIKLTVMQIILLHKCNVNYLIKMHWKELYCIIKYTWGHMDCLELMQLLLIEECQFMPVQ